MINKKKLSDIALLFSNYKQAGLNGKVAVIHGLTPDGQLGRDIDIITSKELVSNVINLTCDFFQANNFKVIRNSVPWGDIIIGFKTNPQDEYHALEVDVNAEFFWGLTSIIRINGEIDTYSVENIPCARWEGFAKRILLQFLSGNIEKYNTPDKTDELTIYAEEKNIVSQRLSRIFGDSMAGKLILALEKKDWIWLREDYCKYGLRFSLWSLLTSPVGFLRNILLRLKIIRFKQTATQKTPDVICINDNKEKAEVFCSNVKSFLQQNYIFSSINIIYIETEDEFRKAKKSYKLKQQMIGLCIFKTKEKCEFMKSNYGLYFDPDCINYKDAAKQIIDKHYQLATK